jgi:hypothetical protein
MVICNKNDQKIKIVIITKKFFYLKKFKEISVNIFMCTFIFIYIYAAFLAQRSTTTLVLFNSY